MSSDILNALSDRTVAIVEKRCIVPPIGCGKQIEGFRNSISRKEYNISGLCQTCQDEVFGGDEDVRA